MNKYHTIPWAAIAATLLIATIGVSTADATNNGAPAPVPPTSTTIPVPPVAIPTVPPEKDGSGSFPPPVPTTHAPDTPPAIPTPPPAEYWEESASYAVYELKVNPKIQVEVDKNRIGDRSVKIALDCPAFTGDMSTTWFPMFLRDNDSEYDEDMAKVPYRWKPAARELWENQDVSWMVLTSKVIALSFPDNSPLDYMAEQALWLNEVVGRNKPCMPWGTTTMTPI